MKPRLAPAHRKVGDFIHAPRHDIETPADGRICYCCRWWAVTPLDEVLFYDDYHSPQCHKSESAVKNLFSLAGERLDTTPKFIKAAFVPHRCD